MPPTCVGRLNARSDSHEAVLEGSVDEDLCSSWHTQARIPPKKHSPERSRTMPLTQGEIPLCQAHSQSPKHQSLFAHEFSRSGHLQRRRLHERRHPTTSKTKSSRNPALMTKQ
ncbi:hypothetical protein KC19_9G081700 [Ceratodon purpureus]|uniref:Uncharacterized protein n=1 Tax=Ceratodon purpureus TaxID=3225 RepID=A0A8T0GPX3_CERPU|nr:hypothetical protein KC19_9G081700 [Ceratodon purpureus]